MTRVPRAALELQSTSEILETQQKMLDIVQGRMESVDFRKRFHAACPVEGATDDDYRMRLAEFPDEHYALWGIHFEGLIVRKPFVRVWFSTFDPLTALAPLVERARTDFAVFQPRLFSFFGPAGLPFDVDTTIYAERITNLQSREKPKRYDRVTIAREATTEFYPEYEQLYEELAASSAERYASKESLQSIQAIVEENLMFRVLIDGHSAGFIAVRPDYDRYLSGYYVVEEILSPDFRGKGFAAAAQRHVIDAVPNSTQLFLGQIDQRNEPSWRTAMSVGRKPVYSAYWSPM
jgi:RimJ/RimL family protein N-acetyltransferase